MSEDIIALTGGSGIGIPFLELGNLFFCIAIIFLLSKKFNIPKVFLYILILSLLPSFFINGFLIDPAFMIDQFRYWEQFILMRSMDFSFIESPPIYLFGLIMNFTSIIMPISLVSVGLANRLIFSVFFIYLYNKKLLTRISGWFLLIYPSLLLYSSLALRDLLVMIFMFLFTLALISRKHTLIILSLLLMFVLKIFIGILFVCIYISFFAFFDKQLKSRVYIPIFWVLSLFLIFAILFDYISEPFNLYRNIMFHEDGGIGSLYPLGSVIEFLKEFIVRFFWGLTQPSFFSFSSLLQLIQATENLAISIFLIIFSYIYFRKLPYETTFWILSFLFVFGVYSLIVFNIGSLSRYKFPILAWYVFSLSAHYCFLINKTKYE